MAAVTHTASPSERSLDLRDSIYLALEMASILPNDRERLLKEARQDLDKLIADFSGAPTARLQ